MKHLLLIFIASVLLTSCGKSSQTTTRKEVSNLPVKSVLSGEELKIVDALLESGEISEKNLLKKILKFNGNLTELNINRIETHIIVSCKNGHCRIEERNI